MAGAPFGLVRASSLIHRDAPPRRFVCEGIIPDRQVTGISGEGGIGKTTIAKHIAACVCLGRPWHGLQTIKGPALIVNAEDELDEEHRRLEKICAYEGVPLTELHDLVLLPLAGRDAVLAVATGEASLKPTPLWKELSATIASLRPKLVVIDPLADVFGGNELSRAQARAFIGMLRSLALEFDLAVALLSHPSLSGIQSGRGTSGNTGWHNSLRSRLYVEQQAGDQNSRVLTGKKANYGPPGFSLPLRWQDGVFVRDDGSAAAAREAAAEAKASVCEEIFLRLLREQVAKGWQFSPSPSATYAPTLFEGLPEAQGFKSKAFKGAMDRLLSVGAIQIEEDGPPSRRRKRLVPC